MHEIACVERMHVSDRPSLEGSSLEEHVAGDGSRTSIPWKIEQSVAGV
jgi:hypothetical protein